MLGRLSRDKSKLASKDAIGISRGCEYNLLLARNTDVACATLHDQSILTHHVLAYSSLPPVTAFLTDVPLQLSTGTFICAACAVKHLNQTITEPEIVEGIAGLAGRLPQIDYCSVALSSTGFSFAGKRNSGDSIIRCSRPSSAAQSAERDKSVPLLDEASGVSADDQMQPDSAAEVRSLPQAVRAWKDDDSQGSAGLDDLPLADRLAQRQTQPANKACSRPGSATGSHSLAQVLKQQQQQHGPEGQVQHDSKAYSRPSSADGSHSSGQTRSQQQQQHGRQSVQSGLQPPANCHAPSTFSTGNPKVLARSPSSACDTGSRPASGGAQIAVTHYQPCIGTVMLHETAAGDFGSNRASWLNTAALISKPPDAPLQAASTQQAPTAMAFDIDVGDGPSIAAGASGTVAAANPAGASPVAMLHQQPGVEGNLHVDMPRQAAALMFDIDDDPAMPMPSSAVAAAPPILPAAPLPASTGAICKAPAVSLHSLSPRQHTRLAAVWQHGQLQTCLGGGAGDTSSKQQGNNPASGNRPSWVRAAAAMPSKAFSSPQLDAGAVLGDTVDNKQDITAEGMHPPCALPGGLHSHKIRYVHVHFFHEVPSSVCLLAQAFDTSLLQASGGFAQHVSVAFACLEARACSIGAP